MCVDSVFHMLCICLIIFQICTCFHFSVKKKKRKSFKIDHAQHINLFYLCICVVILKFLPAFNFSSLWTSLDLKLIRITRSLVIASKFTSPALAWMLNCQEAPIIYTHRLELLHSIFLFYSDCHSREKRRMDRFWTVKRSQCSLENTHIRVLSISVLFRCLVSKRSYSRFSFGHSSTLRTPRYVGIKTFVCAL